MPCPDCERYVRERDEAINGRDDLPMAHEILAQLKKAEARLAKVPPLVEALREARQLIHESLIVDADKKLGDTLAAYEGGTTCGNGYG